MEKKYLNFSIKKSLQLECEERLAESAVSLTEKQKLSLYKKSQKSGIDTGILEEVYRRGYLIWKPDLFEGTREQFAFDRVNSFISGGFAADVDEDLLSEMKMGDPSKLSPEVKKTWRENMRLAHAKRKAAKNPTPKISQNDVDDLVAQYLAKGGKVRKEELELEEKRGLWDNIHAKRRRGERMRKPGEKGAPTDAAFKASQNEEADPCWNGYKQIGMKTKKGKKVPNCVPVKEENYEMPTTNPDLSSSRFDGTNELVNIYKSMTPGQEPTSKSKLVVAIKKTVKESYGALNVPTKFKEVEGVPLRTAYIEGKNRYAVYHPQSPGSTTPKIYSGGGIKHLQDWPTREEAEKAAKAAHAESQKPSARDLWRQKQAALKKEEYELDEATYKGKAVKLNKPFRTPGGPKKSAVYVDPDGDGKAQIVRFGDPNMKIKKNIPARRKSFRARHGCDTNPGPKTKARYWSCRAW